MRVYIAGPIEGTTDSEERFAKRAKEIKAMGHTPINPVELCKELKLSLGREPRRSEIMKYDIEHLLDCEGINYLHEWQNSSGARVEHDVACATEKMVVSVYLNKKRSVS